ncbi:hypothetical protein L1285_22610 [Pseudoalteromonas sp. DL2-H2.2]|uniref:Uncharacterized protein n=1 Tax=Pseudoalteromonas rubra TaxID=43658 RepID=A0A0F4QGB7_9GAMM|nr:MULTISPECIES: hypothetical protein [Pseudoalteromonas]KJZ05712.1 hypothetical protein TW77_21625 [Pseudoalteromonas rubra]MCF2911097.1 hypothetical protein [Pseudoalteromonas sp. DL2-H2.2]
MDFSHLNKASAKSFNEQKALLKKLSKGQTVLCKHCNQPVQLDLKVAEGTKGSAHCAKGCTHIELDLM